VIYGRMIVIDELGCERKPLWHILRYWNLSKGTMENYEKPQSG
jgi:hypothetical protein